MKILFKKGHKVNLGRRPSDETRRLWSQQRKGKRNQPVGFKHSTEIKKYLSQLQMGRKHTPETRRKMSDAHKGKKAYNYKGVVRTENVRLRKSFEYRLWRESVFRRDNFTCIWCGVRGGQLEADHIKPFSVYPALRFAIDNGRTLCKECHKKTDTYGAKASRIHYGN